MEETLAGRVALITGAGSGIGEATAQTLADAGMKVVLVGRRREPLEAVARRLRESGSESLVCPADVREYAQLEEAVALTLGTFLRLDVLVANAAVVDHGAVAEADPSVWQAVITTNVLGVMYAVRAALPHMLERGSGYVVIVSSGSGRHTYVGEPAYIASKHATIAFADSLRKEVSPRGVRVTVVEPGMVETPLLHVHPFALERLPNVVPLAASDCARVIKIAISQPANYAMSEVAVWPVTQVS